LPFPPLRHNLFFNMIIPDIYEKAVKLQIFQTYKKGRRPLPARKPNSFPPFPSSVLQKRLHPVHHGHPDEAAPRQNFSESSSLSPAPRRSFPWFHIFFAHPSAFSPDTYTHRDTCSPPGSIPSHAFRSSPYKRCPF